MATKRLTPIRPPSEAQMESIRKATAASRAKGNGFDQAIGRTRRNTKGAGKSRERKCLEEIQNGQDKDFVLERRYPPRMVKRIKALLSVAEDTNNRDFIHAWRLIREILGKREVPEGEKAASTSPEPDSITVTYGRVDVPMPGTPGATQPSDD